MLSLLCLILASLQDRSEGYNLWFVGKVIVGMADVEAAIKEMFQAPHIQVSWITNLFLYE